MKTISNIESMIKHNVVAFDNNRCQSSRGTAAWRQGAIAQPLGNQFCRKIFDTLLLCRNFLETILLLDPSTSIIKHTHDK